MAQTRSEQETVIRWDEAAQTVSVWSSSSKTWRRAARLGLTVSRETKTGGEVTGRFYAPVPLSQFRWGLKRKGVKGNPRAFAKASAAT